MASKSRKNRYVGAKPAHEYTEAELQQAQAEVDAAKDDEELEQVEFGVSDAEDTDDQPDAPDVVEKPCLTCGCEVQFHYARNKLPVDKFGVTSALKKEMQRAIRKAALHPGKMRVLDDTISDMLKWRDVYREEIKSRNAKSKSRTAEVENPEELF